MTRLLLLLVTGLVSAQAARFEVPRYRLSPGTILWYTGHSEAKDSRGASVETRMREHWVLRDSAGVVRVLLRVADQGYRTDTAGKRTQASADTGWGLFEMRRDGELLRDQSTVNVDIAALFPPLPLDSAAAVMGWQQRDTFIGSVDHYKLDNKSLSDSLWLVDRTQSTPFDSVYGVMTGEARVTIDTRRGLPVRRESRSADTARKNEMQGTIVLDSVTKFNAKKLSPQLRELVGYFDVKRAYEEAAAKADPDDTSTAAQERAVAILKDAAQRTTDSVVKGLLKNDIDEHDRGRLHWLSLRQDRLLRLGRPAPDWSLSDLAGKKHSLKDYLGKVVVLDWWYKDCPWCVLAMPALTEVAQRYAGRPVAILGMNVDRDTNDARFAVKKCKPGYPSLLAGRQLAKEYGVTGYPTFFVIDRDGNIADIHSGYAKDLVARLSKRLDALLEP